MPPEDVILNYQYKLFYPFAGRRSFVCFVHSLFFGQLTGCLRNKQHCLDYKKKIEIPIILYGLLVEQLATEYDTINIIRLPCCMEFSREFNFTDCRLFAFRRNKFSRIWISDFTAGSNISRISGSFLSGILPMVLTFYNIVSSQWNCLTWNIIFLHRSLFFCFFNYFSNNGKPAKFMKISSCENFVPHCTKRQKIRMKINK